MNNYNKIILLSSLLFSGNTYAEEVSVFCSNDSAKWKWLYIDNSLFKKVKVNGTFMDNMVQFSILKKYFTYFKIDGNQDSINNLIQQCINSYGTEYKYAQISRGITSDWYLIGTSDYSISPGNYKIYYMLGDVADSMEADKIFTNKQISVKEAFEKSLR